MVRTTIYPRIDTRIAAISKNFHFKGGIAVVTVDSLGNYSMLVNGSSYSSLENTAKRDSQYKIVVNEVSAKMYDAFQQIETKLVQLHRQAPRIQSESEFRKRIDELVLQTYQREAFPYSRPTREDVRKELAEEADMNYCDLYDDHQEEKNRYILEHEKESFAARLRAYEDIQAFFDEQQDVSAAKINAGYTKDYNRQCKEIEDIIIGEPQTTEARLKSILGEINLPFRVEVTCEYDQAKSLLQTSIEVNNDMNIPTKRPNMLSTGRISVKEKPDKEIEQMRTEMLLSMTYYIARCLFNGSINIQTQRVSVWNENRSGALLWIEFQRKKFAGLAMRNLNPFSDYDSWPHYSNDRIVRGAVRFEPIDSITFDCGIKQSITESGTNSLEKNTQRENEMKELIEEKEATKSNI